MKANRNLDDNFTLKLMTQLYQKYKCHRSGTAIFIARVSCVITEQSKMHVTNAVPTKTSIV